ncbi:MAG: hypothetical protein K6G50_07880 [bacterium]|nr:hypothetical protein [bacterium]
MPDEQPEASDNCEAAKIEEARWHLAQARKISSDSSLLIDNLHDLMFHFVRAEKGLGLKGAELKKAADEILVPFYARSVCETKSSPGSYFFQYNASPLEPILLFYSIRELDLEYLRHYASLHLFNVIKDLWKDVEAFFQRSSYRCKESDYNYLHTMVTEFTKLIERSFAGGQNLATAAEDTERYSFLAHINQVFLQQKVWRINDNGEYVNIDVLSAEDKKSFIDKADEYLMKTAESRKNIAQDKPIATASGKTEEPIDNDDEDDDDSYDEDIEEALAQIFEGTGLKATIVDADDDDDEDDEDEDNEDEDNEDADNEDEDNEDAAEENSAAETDKASYPFPGASATDVNNILPGFSFIGGTVVSASEVQRRTENQANAEGKSSAQPAAGGNSSVAQVNDREKRVSPKIEVVHPKSSRKEPAARAVKNVPAWAVPAKNIKHPPGSRTAPVPVAIENKPAKPPSFENSAGCATAIISMIVLVAAVSGSGGNENGTNVLIFMFFVFAAASALCFYIGSRKK